MDWSSDFINLTDSIGPKHDLYDFSVRQVASKWGWTDLQYTECRMTTFPGLALHLMQILNLSYLSFSEMFLWSVLNGTVTWDAYLA